MSSCDAKQTKIKTARKQPLLPDGFRGSFSADVVKRRPHYKYQRRPSSSKKETARKSDYASKLPTTNREKLDVRCILERCEEYDCSRVFEIELQRHHLQEIPDFLHTFARVRIIDLSCNKISRIDNLGKNLDLRELKLYSNKIHEISGLERLKELNNLLLQHNKIKRIGKGLQQLKKLRVLRLDNNQLSALEHGEIGCCSQITVLDISNNRIADLSALNALPALEELDASNNSLSKAPDLGRCKKLGELDLSRNQISELSGLKGLSSLLVLRVDNNHLTSISSAGKCKSLQELYVSFNKLSRVEALVNQFPALEILHISNNALDSLDDVCTLSQLESLAELAVSENPCTTGGYCQLYHHEIQMKVPSLHMLDGILLKRPTSSRGEAPPPVRPLSVSHILSSRQVEEQLKSADMEQVSFAESITSRFSIVRDLFNSLPLEPPKIPGNTKQPGMPSKEVNQKQKKSSAEEARPGSRCSSRSKIADARAFAAAHFERDPEGVL